MLKYRRNKLRRVLTVPPEPFPHGLQDYCTVQKTLAIYGLKCRFWPPLTNRERHLKRVADWRRCQLAPSFQGARIGDQQTLKIRNIFRGKMMTVARGPCQHLTKTHT